MSEFASEQIVAAQSLVARLRARAMNAQEPKGN